LLFLGEEVLAVLAERDPLVPGVGDALRFAGVVAAELAARRERRGGISIGEKAVLSENDREKSRRKVESAAKVL